MLTNMSKILNRKTLRICGLSKLFSVVEFLLWSYLVSLTLLSTSSLVSLWSGAVVLHNMELKPNVIQDEFNLPFYLSSGYIHELCIHVPWMKIMSEPIMITINTIECVLTLKTDSTTEKTPSKNSNKQEAPPGYIQSLVNRIVNNISFRCNNLILKYVEEDIVLSLNIKHLYLDSVNGNWEPTFTDISLEDLHLRKLINLSDLTLCLDKRNAAGKIETYLEPLLYRCELKMKLDSAYSGLLQKIPLYIRCHLSSPKIEISISHQQIPMIKRIAALILALKKKHIQIIHQVDSKADVAGGSSDLSNTENSENVSETVEDSWSSWAMSFMTPIYSSDDEDLTNNKMDPKFLLGIDLKSVSVVFKIPDNFPNTTSLITTKKTKQISTAKLVLSSVNFEMSSHLQRFCLRGGFNKIEVYPENFCICGVMDGQILKKHHCGFKFLESTSDIEAGANKAWPIEYNEDSVINDMSDVDMLEICPAFALNYTYILTLPDDFDELSKEITHDLEYSNFKESTSVSMACGPMTWYPSTGLIHRIYVIKSALAMYDYSPYYTPKPLLKKSELPPPTTDDYDTFVEYIPKFSFRLYAIEQKLILTVWNHPDLGDIKNPMPASNVSSFSTHKKTIQSEPPSSTYYKLLQQTIPHLLFNASSIEITLNQPLYPIRITYVTCQLPDAPPAMFEACHNFYNIKVNNLRCSLSQTIQDSLKSNEVDQGNTRNKNLSLPVLNECTFHLFVKKLILPEYWSDNNEIITSDVSLNIDNISLCGTMPKLMTIFNILFGYLNTNHNSNKINELVTSSLLQDITCNEMVHMEIIFDGILIRIVNLPDTSTYRLVVNSTKAFAIKPNDVTSSGETVWILSTQDTNKLQSGPFIKLVYQNSPSETYASFLTAKVEECSLIFDPILYQFISYKKSFKETDSSLHKEKSPTPKRTSCERSHKRSVDESTVHQGSKSSHKYTSLQSQSDREKDFVHSTHSTPHPNIDPVDNAEITYSNACDQNTKAEAIANLIDGYKKLALSIEIESFSIYLPTKPISALNYQTIDDAVRANVLLDKFCYLESILVIRLSNTLIKSSALKKHLLEYCVHGLPSRIPSAIWDKGMVSYPWQISISDLNSFTLSRASGNEVSLKYVLKPVTSNIVVSLSTKYNEEHKKEVPTRDMQQEQHPSKCQGCISCKKSPKENLMVTSPTTSQSSVSLLTSLGVIVHIDTGWIIMSLNKQQITTISLLAHGLTELSSTFCENKETDSSQIPTSAPSATVDVGEQKSLENISNTSDVQSTNATKIQKGFSYEDSGINEESIAVEVPAVQTSSVLVTFWVQLTVSRFTLKCYAIAVRCDELSLKSCMKQLNVPKFKLVFEIEDIMASFDMHPEYIKLKCKMVTANLKYFKRDPNLFTWILGENNGVVLRGRENDEPLNQNEETSFIFITLTFARSSSVHNKWNETGKKIAKKFDTDVGEFIWEIEVSVQSLDIILIQECIQAFMVTFNPAFCGVQCDSNSTDNNCEEKDSSSIFSRPEMWNAAVFPLCYFTSRQVRVFVPSIHKNNSNNHDVIILEINKLWISPTAENPICRRTLRPDLYELAARESWLGLPGGPLEDRQTQLTLKGISVYTCQLKNIAQMEEPEDSAVNENPAVIWNNSTINPTTLCSDQLHTIINNMNVHIVLALAMFHKTTLVSGPAIDIGFMTDIEINMSVAQLTLISSIYCEYKNVMTSVKMSSKAAGILEFSDEKHCPFNRYIAKFVLMNRTKRMQRENKSNIKAFKPSNNSDDGVFNQKTADKPKEIRSMWGLMKPEKNVKENKNIYFDLVCTLGKIKFIYYKEIEENIKKDTQNKRTIPLLYTMLHQPNFFISIRQSKMLMQASIFSVQFSSSNKTLKHIPSSNDFHLHILESKASIPDPTTGISSPLILMKIEQNSGPKSTANFSINCPVLFHVSEEKIDAIKILNQFTTEATHSCTLLTNETANKERSQDIFKETFGSLATLKVSIAPTTINFEKTESTVCSLSFSSLKLESTINSRTEKVHTIGLMESFIVTLNVSEINLYEIIIAPWTIGMELTVSWEPWRDLQTDLQPVFQLFLDTDMLVVRFGINDIVILQEFIEYWSAVINKKVQSKSAKKVKKNLRKPPNFWSQTSANDQHYKDDLRAGAFKYVNCITDTVPLPYQVIIGQRQISWCYPHPRAVTHLYSYPLPFQLEAGVDFTDTVVCILQYYSEITHSFMFYAKFYIRQDQAIKLDLPINNHNMRLASVWRIEMLLPSENTESLFKDDCCSFDKMKYLKTSSLKQRQPYIVSDVNATALPVSPKMLPGCLRVDSYSTPNALPNFQFALRCPQLNVNFYNYSRKLTTFSHCDKSKLFTLDNSCPPKYVFTAINLKKNFIEGLLWNKHTGIVNINTDLNVDILNNSDFSLSRAISCKNNSGIIWWGGKNVQEDTAADILIKDEIVGSSLINGVSFTIDTTELKIASHMINTIIVSTKRHEIPKFCSYCRGVLRIEDVIHRYIIKNDTCVALRISQDNTNETLLLPPRMATLYQWYQFKKPHLITFEAHDGDWKTAAGLQIDECGIQQCNLVGELGLPSLDAVVYVEPLGPCHRSVTLSGSLIIFNLLDEKIEFKLYQKKSSERTMVSPVFLLEEKSQHPSLFVDTSCESTFRIHIANSAAGWTGDIPLKPTAKETLPWLVKVPVKAEMEFICLWCRVQSDSKTKRILVTLSPLYMIRSHFPTSLEVKLKSQQAKQNILCIVIGKGTIQPLKLPGTTDTQHNIIFQDRFANDKSYVEQNIPFSFDRDLFKKSMSNCDFDKSLKNLQNWLKKPLNWYYIENECEKFKHVSLYSMYPAEIHVSFSYEVESIDSVIIEMTPWTYFCNYSEIELSLFDMNKIEMCTLEHRSMATPPVSKLIPHFYMAIIEEGFHHLSAPLAISTDMDERTDDGVVIINLTKSFLIHCIETIAVFSVSHEIMNSINIFRFSTAYVMLNRTKLDLWVVPLAVPVDFFENSTKLDLPTNIINNSDQVLCAASDDSHEGQSITHFFLPTSTKMDNTKIYEESDFAFYIWLSCSEDGKYFGCPIRLDKFTSRKCMSLKCKDESIPLTINFKRENDQTFIAVSEDHSPQFLIQNNTDVCLAVGESVIKFLPDNQIIEVTEECDIYNWHHQVDVGMKIYYTTPLLTKTFPDMQSDLNRPTNHLSFAVVNCDEKVLLKKYEWSTPVNVSITSSEQCVKLPGWNKDIKVSVESHVHSTYITLDNISQVDISAGVIRSRIVDRDQTVQNELDEIFKVLPPPVENWEQSYFDGTVKPLLIQNIQEEVAAFESDLAEEDFLNKSVTFMESLANLQNPDELYSSKILEFLAKMNVFLKINDLSVTLFANGDEVPKDVSYISCKDIVFTSVPTVNKTSMVLSVYDLQMDNPLHSQGEYDFPVPILRNKTSIDESPAEYLLNQSCYNKFIHDLVDMYSLRENALITVHIDLEIWNQKTETKSGIMEVSLTLQPLLAYIEDTYITVIGNFINEFGPWDDDSICPCSRLDKDNQEDNRNVRIPENIVTEIAALTRPIQIESLQINPFNVVLSLHANLQVYIALDHSPLQFSRFERKNILTTSYRLGHALTMHYLSETIYRAGWVVGSLEILGCPGGFARRVGAGLKAFVAEPCRGLLGRGPWGFVVGVTQGSGVLLKHITQGTAESVSMVASNVARNLDRLSFDTEHVRNAEAARRARPRGLPQGLARGFKALALGVVNGATSFMSSPPNLTKGILGIVTKPLSATADLVAFTTQGLLGQVGWDPLPQPIHKQPEEADDWPSEWQEWRLKLNQNILSEASVLHACKGRHRDTGRSVALIITNKWLLLVDLEREKVQQIIDISCVAVVKNEGADLCISIHKEVSKEDAQEYVSRSRVAAYVGESVPSLSSVDDFLRIHVLSCDISYTVSVINMVKEHYENCDVKVL